MAYAHKVCRVTFSGKMWSGQEEWSTGLFLGMVDDDSSAPTQEQADAAAGAFKTMFTHGNMKIANAYTFEKVKLASIGTNGQTIANEVVYATPPGGIGTGAATTGHHPSQCSLVVTLASERPRGVASKGRMYLPGTAVNIDNGRIPTADRTNMSGILATFFDTFVDQFFYPGVLILAAKESGPAGIFPPQNDAVSKIRLGDVVDTQRRRRNGLSESYTTVELPL